MIIRTTKFLDAEYRVKVSHFTRQGFDIGNVVHVGSNDGYEIPWYFDLGAQEVIAFDPLPLAISSLNAKFQDDPRVQIFPYALSDKAGELDLMISDGDGQGSTFLRHINPPYVFSTTTKSTVVRFDDLNIDLDGFNTLVVDTQGMELPVLRGFGDRLQEFSFLNIECSQNPLYEGGAPAAEVIAYLESQGFEQDSPMVVHDDIFFVKRGLRTMRVGLNVGSGQRPFKTVPKEIKWWNIDSQVKWNPDAVADGSRTGFPDESVDYVVLHHVLEHFGCGEGLGLIAEAWRVLKPGGSLLVFVPNLRALSQRWLAGDLNTQVYVTNLYGAYMGDEADRHKWGFDPASLMEFLSTPIWRDIRSFNWRPVPGADIAKDWWIIGMEAIK